MPRPPKSKPPTGKKTAPAGKTARKTPIKKPLISQRKLFSMKPGQFREWLRKADTPGARKAIGLILEGMGEAALARSKGKVFWEKPPAELFFHEVRAMVKEAPVLANTLEKMLAESGSHSRTMAIKAMLYPDIKPPRPPAIILTGKELRPKKQAPPKFAPPETFKHPEIRPEWLPKDEGGNILDFSAKKKRQPRKK